MTVEVGLSSFTYPWAVDGLGVASPLGPEDLLDLAVEEGVGVVQFADNLPLHLLTEARIAGLDTSRRAAGMRIEVGTRGIGDHLLEYARLATRFDADFVRLVVDQGDDHPDPDEVVARLLPYRAAFEERGLRLAIENHDRFPAQVLVDLLVRLGPWSAICLDTANSLGCLEPPSTVIPLLAPHAVNLHLKDFAVRRKHAGLGFDVVGAPAGSGMLDIDALLTAVELAGDCRSAILELWTPPQADPVTTIATEREWATMSLRHLRAATALVFAV